MAVTASQVKQLREMTGAGMMDCKKALAETEGQMDDAVEFLRKKGMAGADKKEGRTAAEGVIAIAMTDDKKKAAIVEVNCETDFVAKGDEFKQFADAIAQVILTTGVTDPDALMNEKLENGQTVDERRRELVGRIGENMTVRRTELIETSGQIGQYQHGEKIGVVVAMEGGDDQLLRDVAMHVAASKPAAVSEKDVDADMIEKERQFQIDQAKESGKPDNIIEKMIEGRMRKFLQEITLMGQAFVKDPDQSVEKLLQSGDAEVEHFVRLEVGEGIEIEDTNFADEVAAAAQAAKS